MKTKITIISAMFICFLSLSTRAQIWSAVGNGINGQVSAMVVFNGELYVAGSFNVSLGNPSDNIAKWNGTSWSTLGTGITGLGPNGLNGASVSSLAVYNNELYVGGYFTAAGGVTASCIAKWNGTTWSAVGAGRNSTVNALAVYNGELYAGGRFIDDRYIAKWNGTTWSAVGGEFNGFVNTLAVYNGNLYSGGVFTRSSNTVEVYDRIAKWNGTAWSGVGTGMNTGGDVNAFTVFNSELYVGGKFTTVNGMAAERIAKWNGTTWSAVGGMNDQVNALYVYNNELYAGGSFYTSDANPISNVAKWNGTAWETLGSGTDNPVSAFASYNNDLYVGGTFIVNPYPGIARWTTTATGISDISSAFSSLSVYPNPASSSIKFSAASSLEKHLRIVGITGKEIWSSPFAGQEKVLSVLSWQKGIYFYRITSGNGDQKSGKFIVD